MALILKIETEQAATFTVICGHITFDSAVCGMIRSGLSSELSQSRIL